MAAAAAMASRKAVMICATWQHVGKTSVSMALVDAVGKALAANGGGEGGRTPRVGYMKPVGQKWVSAVNSRDPTGPVLRVDKDVALAREHFNMQMDYLDMSPIIIERGSTRVRAAAIHSSSPAVRAGRGSQNTQGHDVDPNLNPNP